MLGNNVYYRLMSAIIMLALASELGLAQEVCHWECEVIDCDYYIDYCDYDCYEVCYPYASIPVRSGQGHVASSQSKSPQSFGTIKGGQRNHGAVKSISRKDHHGKVVKMKIMNPSFQTTKNGQILSTRGSPPRSFALLAGDCLSSRRNPIDPSA